MAKVPSSDIDLGLDTDTFDAYQPNAFFDTTEGQRGNSFNLRWVMFIVVGVILVVASVLIFTNKPKTTKVSFRPTEQASTGGPFTTTKSPSVGSSDPWNVTTQECQAISDTYGTYPGNWKGAVYKEVREVWNKNKCKTLPSTFTCQDISNAFNMGPNSVNKWGIDEIYKQKGCTTIPQMTCQMISDTYDVYPGHAGRLNTLNGIEKDVLKSAWENMNCQTVPKNMTCQGLSNFYMMSPRHPGLAENYPQVYGYFRNKGCITEPLSCEYISQQYRVPEQAPPVIDNIHAAWANQKCKTTPAPKGYITIQGMASEAPDEYVNKKLHHAVEYCDATAQCVGIEYDKETGLYKTKHRLRGKKDAKSNFYRKV